MILKRLKGLVLISTFIGVFYSCKTNTSLENNDWKLETFSIEIDKDWEYLKKSEPGMLESKLKRPFGDAMNIGDILSVKKDLLVAKNDTFKYSIDGSRISLRKSDIVYTFNWSIADNELQLKKRNKHGEISWILVKK